MMESQFRMCRVCRTHEGDGELVPIFEKNNRVAMGLFIISGVKVCAFKTGNNNSIAQLIVCFQILELSSYRVPALICISCIKDLSKAMKFRHKCRETDDFFKKSTYDIESLIWNGTQPDLAAAPGSQLSEQVTIKNETNESHAIKDEPVDEFHISLFESIDTILEERAEGSEQSTMAGILKRTKREDSYSESSESEYEEIERSRRPRTSRISDEYADFDVG